MSVEASLWTCERKSDGEKVVELSKKRFPLGYKLLYT
jgi:hypothetical protein